LDVSLLRENRQRAKTFQNTPDGWQDLVAWLTALGIEQVHVGLGQFRRQIATTAV
jgi:hypothetical protein